MKLILASGSPRRKHILEQAGFKFDIVVSDCDESVGGGLSPSEMTSELALRKAKSVFARTGGLVLGADTVVALDGEILTKPKDAAEAREMLAGLSGRRHTVYSGYAIVSDASEIVSYDSTDVYFNALSDELIDEYVRLGLGMDKAGGYGIQDGFDLAERIEGSYYNVMGLPIEKIKPILLKELKR